MIALTLWHASGLRAAWAGAQRLVELVQPDVVQLHASPDGLRSAAPGLATEVRRTAPNATVWLGVASDSPALRYAEGKWPLDRAADALLVAADVATEIGAAALVWNGEAAYKLPTKTSRDRAPLVREVVTRCHEANPQLVQGHTAYDQPHLHGQYPWPAWIGPGSPVRIALPQVYVQPLEGQALAPKNALAKRLEKQRASFERVRKLGWVKPEAELTVVPYFRVHHTAARDIASVWGELGAGCAWAAPTRLDAEGERALLALAKLRDAGFRGAGAVRRYQADAGLAADGLVGPRTMQALGL